MGMLHGGFLVNNFCQFPRCNAGKENQDLIQSLIVFGIATYVTCLGLALHSYTSVVFTVCCNILFSICHLLLQKFYSQHTSEIIKALVTTSSITCSGTWWKRDWALFFFYPDKMSLEKIATNFLVKIELNDYYGVTPWFS